MTNNKTRLYLAVCITCLKLPNWDFSIYYVRPKLIICFILNYMRDIQACNSFLMCCMLYRISDDQPFEKKQIGTNIQETKDLGVNPNLCDLEFEFI